MGLTFHRSKVTCLCPTCITKARAFLCQQRVLMLCLAEKNVKMEQHSDITLALFTLCEARHVQYEHNVHAGCFYSRFIYYWSIGNKMLWHTMRAFSDLGLDRYHPPIRVQHPFMNELLYPDVWWPFNPSWCDVRIMSLECS